MTRARRWDWTLTIVFLVTCLPARAIGTKDHETEAKDHVVNIASLNETVYHDIELEKTNEMPSLLNEVDVDKTLVFDDNHPHKLPGKPSKLDMDMNQLMINETMEKINQIESTRLENPTISSINDEPVEPPSSHCRPDGSFISCMEEDLSNILDKLTQIDRYNLTDSIQIVRTEDVNGNVTNNQNKKLKNVTSVPNLLDKIQLYAKQHVVEIKFDKNFVANKGARTFFGAIFQGKSTFLTGFGLGFLAFGLKKLLLPLIIGAQIIKSILIALFLPSIIGSIGKIVGKGVSSFAQSSQGITAMPEENFEFKDNVDMYNEDYFTRQPVGTLPGSAMYDESMLQTQKNPQDIASRYSMVDPRLPNAFSDRYYTRHVAHNGFSKKQDFKVFHEIPTSSLLLTNYDPFYSPLLSRLDAVFSRLGHVNEGCREYAVCAMYRSPARYAPYSNLVSAQLSRELNELRKPSSDNPDVLRFFRYMKAAKDGQDGIKCEDVYNKCAFAREDQSLKQNQAMLATYQDIDKLVHARKIQ